MHKKSVLFVYINFSSFVKADFDILSAYANVTKYQFKPEKVFLKLELNCLKSCSFFFLMVGNTILFLSGLAITIHCYPSFWPNVSGRNHML